MDQTVQELGPPEKSSPMKDGTVVAEWVIRRGTMRPYPAYGLEYPGRYRRSSGVKHIDYSPDYILRLTFGADGKLQSSKYLWR
jgi:hypothetical protein